MQWSNGESLLPISNGLRGQPLRPKVVLFGLVVLLLLLGGLLVLQGRPQPTATTWPLSAGDDAAPQQQTPGESQQSPWADLRTLIVVAGHSVFTGHAYDRGVADPSNWFLENFQQGQQGAFLDHIRLGVYLGARLPDSLLLFSGGASRAAAGPRTEAQSYWLLADAFNWFGQTDEVAAGPGNSVRFRSGTEDFARDSFENLLFSVARFRELAGRLPERIVVVSFGFKAYRFTELHRTAMRFPSERFYFAGLDPVVESENPPPELGFAGEAPPPAASSPPLQHLEVSLVPPRVRSAGNQLLQIIQSHQPQPRFPLPVPGRVEPTSSALRRALAGELLNSVEPFRADPYGCQGPLREKRLSRNPFRRWHGYEQGAPELRGLLGWCGPELYPLDFDIRMSASNGI